MAKRILLVDDDRDLVLSLEKVLRQHLYDVHVAYSAADGLRATLAVRPDLIVLDVSMETDTAGFELLNLLRSTRPSSRYKEVRSTPVLLLTAINQVTNSRFSLDDRQSFLPTVSGMLTKPVKTDDLLTRVREILERSGGTM